MYIYARYYLNTFIINMKKFHERLSFVIDKVLDKSGNAIARELNVNGGAVNKYKKGEMSPSVEFVEKFCLVYGVCGSFLINGLEPVLVSDLKITANNDIGSVHMFEKEHILREELKKVQIIIETLLSK